MSMKEEANKMLDLMWGNWDSGLKKFYESQQQYGKASLELVKKQQEMFTIVTSRLTQSEEEMKNNLAKMTQAYIENNKSVMNEATLQLFTEWNEKMTEIVRRIQQISDTPSKAVIDLLTQSQERFHDSAKKVIDEQTNMQTETRELFENFIAKVKLSQYNLVNMMEETVKTK
ncbi:hypothetical protein AWH56_019450 [Anaerobacillus isosaccharinicus]|uniref:Polyhydroxyalkanoic acid inclusion protein PhaP n=1 Tax=Anaerobacillus isosaccharinicus TaxID=1532552 RepID=A0A1S2L7H4_9BACI|nr:hypothetical protein [Anaerobacillus isosaccharinicus]MBA5586919.1 hypothetical protein [Anaerobacillus isosaccharinicus]QOY34874.1 hypothetical protein AWH56_019450 [Anaerobacillus isosaccharinicus]